MCGIAGFITPTSEPAAADLDLRRMLDSIRHRGPDGEGRWIESAGRVAVGMRRLSVIDLVTGDQPLWNEDKTIGVVFNGEIYNYRELREELCSRGHVFQSKSDTETLVHGYEEEGVAFLNRLRGMFALCWIDTKARALIFARDPFGQKPLYWFQSSNTFAFASEIKALRVLPHFPPSIREESLLDYLSWFSLPSPETHYEHIQKMPPGTWMSIAWDNATLTKPISYLHPSSPGKFSGSMDDALDALHERLLESVSLHLRSDVPLGLLLSGGVDSLALGYYAKSILGQAPATFTAVFDSPGTERDAARETAERLHSRHTEVLITPDDFLTRAEWLVHHLDEPMGDPAAIALGMLCETAKTEVSVLLSGEGSDEIFAGYAGRYLGEKQTLEKSAAWRKYLPFLGEKHPKKWPTTRLSRMRWRIGAKSEGELPTIPTEGLPGYPVLGFTKTQSLRFLQRASQLGSRLVPKSGSFIQRGMSFDRAWQLPEYLLQKADKMSMASSIESRAPFLDPQLVHFSQSLPDSFLIDPPSRTGKIILRKLLESRHGADTMKREKRGFFMPLELWLRGPLKRAVEETIFDSAAAWRSVLEENLVRDLWQNFQENRGATFHAIYALWLYEIWRKTIA